MASEASPNVNGIPPLVVWAPITGATRSATGVVLTNSTPQHVAIVDADGTQITSFGSVTQYTEDAASAANPIGNALIVVREDARAGSLTTTDGDNVALRGNNLGELYVKHTDSIAVTSSTFATSAKQDTIIGHVDGIEGILTTIDADTGNIDTSLNAIEASVAAIDTDTTTIIGHLDGVETLLTTVAGAVSGSEMQVDVITMPTVAVTGTFWQATQPVSATDLDIRNLVAATDIVDLGGNALTSLQLIDNAISGTGFNITQFAGVNNVTGSGTATGALRVELPTNGTGVIATLTTLTGGGVAHDSADSGNPLKVGFKAYSPDGTTPGTAVAELDRTDAKADLDGRLYVNTGSPRDFSYHDDDAAAVTTDGTAAADPGDGFAVFITDIIFSIGAATASSIFLEEGSTKILGPYYLEAIAGRGLVMHFKTPKRCTASTAILVTNTGSILFSIDILGFVAAV